MNFNRYLNYLIIVNLIFYRYFIQKVTIYFSLLIYIIK